MYHSFGIVVKLYLLFNQNYLYYNVLQHFSIAYLYLVVCISNTRRHEVKCFAIPYVLHVS